MGVQVAFNYGNFITLFPEFENVDEGTVAAWFDVVGNTVCRNDGYGPVSNAKTQEYLMDCATAHIMQLMTAQINGVPNTESSAATPSPNLVGHVGSATEGSVSVSAELPSGMPASSGWWTQTKYGYLWWQMTKPYRTMRYLPGPQRYFGPLTFSGYAGQNGLYAGGYFIGLSGNVLF